jgi:hypothetical protein
MSKINMNIFLAGVVLIIIGYIFLSIGPADGFLSLTLAPIILVLAYCVVIPFSLLYKAKNKAN